MATNVLNLSNCGLTGNTGISDCGLDPKLFQYAIFIPKGFEIPNASLTNADTVMAYLQSHMQADTRSTTFYRTPLLTNIENKTDALKEEDRDGYKKPVFEPAWNLQWLVNGTFCDYQNMLNFKNQQAHYDVLMVDANNVVYGKATSTGLGGWSLYNVYITIWSPTTVSTAAKYMLQLKFQNNADYTTNLGYIDGSASSTLVSEMDGLLTTTLRQGATTPNTSSALYIAGSFGCGSNSIGYYGSVLNTASAWVVKSSAGVTRTVSGVTYNSTLDQFVLASSAAFANGDVVSLAAPSVLLALSGAPNLITPTTFSVAI